MHKHIRHGMLIAFLGLYDILSVILSFESFFVRMHKWLYTIFMSLVIALLLIVTNGKYALATTGAIFTTNVGCNGTDLNIYANKDDVYIDGGPKHQGSASLTDGYYYVKVTEPNGNLLGTSVGSGNDTPIHVTSGSFDQCYQLSAILIKHSNGTSGYDTTTNAGGEYKVWVSATSTFDNSSSKTDNFQISTSPTPTSIPTATPTQIPTATPTQAPTPTSVPTATPTLTQCELDEDCPTITPTDTPTPTPITVPTATPGSSDNSGSNNSSSSSSSSSTPTQAVLGVSTMAATGTFTETLMNIIASLGMISLGAGFATYAKEKNR